MQNLLFDHPNFHKIAKMVICRVKSRRKNGEVLPHWNGSIKSVKEENYKSCQDSATIKRS